jgi:hypothetical protein
LKPESKLPRIFGYNNKRWLSRSFGAYLTVLTAAPRASFTLAEQLDHFV